MDNLSHSLVGAALAQTGLKRLTGLGTATVVIGANAPDLDVLGLLFGENLAWRRGLTHGPLGMLLLPPLLALGIVMFDRWQTQRGTRPPDRLKVKWPWVLLLACLGTASHPFLDWLNVYGVRLLMPFSDRWYYGDMLFIVDPWLWITLSLGIWLALRRERHRACNPGMPAIVALSLFAGYCGVMAAAGRGAEAYTARTLATKGVSPTGRILASPTAINPFRWTILVETKDGYAFGEFIWSLTPILSLQPDMVATDMENPFVTTAAEQDRQIADFLYWSRFPFATVRQVAGGTEVIIGDARYGVSPEDGPFSVRAFIPEVEY